MKIARLTCDVCGTAQGLPEGNVIDVDINTAPAGLYGDPAAAAAFNVTAANELIVYDPSTGTRALFRRVADEEADA